MLPSRHDDNEPETPTFDNCDQKKHVINEDAHTPPLAKQLAMRRVHAHKTAKHEPPELPKSQSNMTSAMHAQLDTGADETCSNTVETLHDHREHSKSFPCEVCLVGAIRKDDDKDLGVHPSGKDTCTSQQHQQLDASEFNAHTQHI